MPCSRSSGELSVKRLSQDGNLLACLDMSRPINERKVGTSGTNGVGDGTGGLATFLWRDRTHCLEIMLMLLLTSDDSRPRRRLRMAVTAVGCRLLPPSFCFCRVRASFVNRRVFG